jgi:hypothetical protein
MTRDQWLAFLLIVAMAVAAGAEVMTAGLP